MPHFAAVEAVDEPVAIRRFEGDVIDPTAPIEAITIFIRHLAAVRERLRFRDWIRRHAGHDGDFQIFILHDDFRNAVAVQISILPRHPLTLRKTACRNTQRRQTHLHPHDFHSFFCFFSFQWQ